MAKRLAGAALCMLLALSLCACAARPSVVYTARPEGTRLTVLFGESTSDPGVGDMLRAHIEQHFPEVELEWESVDWGEQFSGRLNAKIASGETPDLIIGKAQDVQAYSALGALGTFPEDFASLLTEQGQIASTVDGALYGLTYNQIYQGVLYNKNIFYRFNLTPPETIEELRAIVDRLESAGQVAFAAHFQETWYTGNILMQFALNEVFSRVPDWGDLCAGAHLARRGVRLQQRGHAPLRPGGGGHVPDRELVGADAAIHRALPQDRLFSLSKPDWRFQADRGAQHHLHEERDHRARRAH